MVMMRVNRQYQMDSKEFNLTDTLRKQTMVVDDIDDGNFSEGAICKRKQQQIGFVTILILNKIQ